MPFANRVDVQITQQTPASGHNHTWVNYGFGEFSNWTSAFEVGTGAVTVWENVGGTRGAELLSVSDIPLTPGPLVVVLKCINAKDTCAWPPASTQLGGSVETIAASFTPVAQGAVARLFNLAPTTPAAAMAVAGESTASGVKYALGSEWVPVPAGDASYVVTDTASGATVASVSYAPTSQAPAGVGAFTQWLLGGAGAAAPFGARLLPLDDAPEKGRCNPSSL